ncbi:MAG: Calx-beta domain-containing protein [Acidobacteriota bacterium]
MATPALAGPPPPYQLVFVAPTPLPPDVNEGDMVMFGVQLQNPCAGTFTPITWDVSVQPGLIDPADATDFGPPSPAGLTFSDGALTQIFTVPIVDDGATEGPETFDIRLSPSVSGVDLNCSVPSQPPSQPEYGLTVTILGDGAMIVDVSINDVVVNEGDMPPEATFQISLSQPNPDVDPVSVNWATANGTAIAGQDYATTAGVTNLMPGESSAMITIPVLDDSLVEGDEFFFVDILGTSTNAQIVDAQGQATIEDNDDDGQMGDITIADAIGMEGQGSLFFDLTLTPPNPGPDPVTVDWSTADGSAESGPDYVAASGQVAFLPGDSAKQIEITLVDDSELEPTETFFINLSNPSTGAMILDPQARGAIQDDDDDPGETPTFSVGDVSIVEGNEGAIAAEILVVLAAPSDKSARVDFSTADGTATAEDRDYQPNSGSLEFPAGTVMRRFVVPILGDVRPEDDEQFRVLLSNPVNAVIGDGEAIVTIINDDVAQQDASLSIDSVGVLEGNEGLTQAVFTVTLSRDGASENGGVTVSYATMDGTATTADMDYEPASGELTFEGETTTQTVTVNVIGDTRVEPDEGFFVDLSAADGAVIEQGRGRGLIRNDDSEGEQPTLSVSDAAVDEGDEGTTSAVFTVTLSAASIETVAVDFETADGTATAGEDYQANSGSLTFSPGQVQRTFNVLVAGDTDVEADELFAINLFNAMGAEIADGMGRGLIRNDDGAEVSRIRFVRERQTVMEGAGAAEIIVERIGGVSGPAQVIVSTASGTASAGQDFVALREAVRWRPGEGGRKSVAVRINDDNLQEPDEALGLRLSQPAGAELATPSEQVLGLIDDDTPLRLEAVGDQEVTARVREDFELQVKATRMDGSPVAGATVEWRVSGRAELVGPQERQSDGEGLSTARIRPATMPGPAAVVARLQGTDSAVSFAIMVEGDLGDLGSGGDQDLDEGDMDIAGVLDEACATATGDLLEACEYLFGIASSDDRRQAVERLTPRNAVTQGNAALRAPRIQLRNIGGRLNALRGGSTRLAAADHLSISIQGDAVAMGTLRSAVSSYGMDLEKLSQAVDTALRKSQGLAPEEPRGGAASADSVDTESPWGLFINGRVSFGEAPQTDRESGYDFDTQGITAGVDYRVSDRLVLGIGLGYLGTDVDVADDGGTLEVSGYSLSLYGTFYTRNFYLDAIVAYGRNDYELERILNLPVAFRGGARLVTRGEPEGDQLSVDLGVGYDFSIGAATLGGFVRASLVDATVDAYGEIGAGPFDLLYGEQEIESLQGEAGFELSYPASFNWGVVQPSLRLSYLHEFSDDRRVIRARFRSDALGRPFAVVTDTPDRDFFNVGAGVTVTLPRSMATYLLFDTDLERDDLDIYTLSGGFRFQF